MSLEAILTVIAVILGVLAIIPQERSQDLRLRLGGSATIVVTLAGGVVLYWSLLEPLHALPWLRRVPRVVPWLAGWDPASSSLAILLLATGYCWWTYRRRLPVTQLDKLCAVLTNALARRRFAECTHLIEAHFDSIRGGLGGSYWQSRLRKRLFPTPAESHLAAFQALKRTSTSTLASASGIKIADSPSSDELVITMPPLKEPARIVRWFNDWAERPADAAADIARLVSLSPELGRHIAATHPYLGLELSQLPSTWLVREFSETFSRALFSDPESILYRELGRAQNVDQNRVPVVDPVEQPLLAMLCDDAARKDGPKFLYTYAYAGIQLLDGGVTSAARDEINRPIGSYFDRGRWSSPFFATVYLFEITALRNAVSSEAPPLNLYDLRRLVSALLQELSPTSDVDSNREWPTPIHYLLYESVSLLVDLVAIWRDRASDLPPQRLSQMVDGFPRILSVHAIDVLSSVMYETLRSSKLDPRFKGYLLEVWWRAYWEKYKPAWEHSGMVLSRLVQGGAFGMGDLKHRDGLVAAFEHVDTVLRITEGGQQVLEAFGVPRK